MGPSGIVIWIVILLVGAAIGFASRMILQASSDRSRQREAANVLESARRQAESLLKEAEIKTKEALLESRTKFEEETREERRDLQKLEKRLQQRDENLDKKFETLDKKEQELVNREKSVAGQQRATAEKEKELLGLIEEQRNKLELISEMSAEQAKEELKSMMVEEARIDSAKLIKRIEEEARETADKKAKEIISFAIQRYSGEYVAEKAVTVVNLPSDEMKGRIIGREGRNIRSFETVTGVDLIVDDT
ncbi:MAG: DUF3552 domain-containing protein, partial [bacterium]